MASSSSSRQQSSSNESILQQLRDGTASFEFINFPSTTNLRFFAKIGYSSSSSLGGSSPAMKKVQRFSVQKVTGDGRCLFRALVKGMARNKGIPLSPAQEREDADELRMAVKEVICDDNNERIQYEEALVAITVEESLKRYCQRIPRSDFWGGESELLVLSKLCHQPIIVYIPEQEDLSLFVALVASIWRHNTSWLGGFDPTGSELFLLIMVVIHHGD